MTLLELTNKLITPKNVDAAKALDFKVEFRTIKRSKLFNTIDKSNLSLLSVYEEEGKIVIEIGK